MFNIYSIKLKLSLILLITALITPIGLLAYVFLVKNQAQQTQQQLIIKKKQQEKVFFFKNSLANAYSDILYVSRLINHKLSNQLKNDGLIFDTQLSNEINFTFKSFLQVNPLYQQIRLIDNSGQERVRFNRRHNQVVSTKTNKLQNKSEQSYVKKSLNLQPGEIYISELNLNQENGIIERPYNPTLRIATKLDNTANGFKGLIIINISAQKIIDEITKNLKGNTYLINQKGQYIVYPDSEAPLAYPHNFNTDFPELKGWQQSKSLQKNNFTAFKTNKQYFYFYPIDSGSQFHRQWFLITSEPILTIWNQIQQQTVLITTTLIAILLSILLANYISRYWFINPIRYMRKVTQGIVEERPIKFINNFHQKDELGSLCKKLHQLAKIISTKEEKNKLIIQSLNNEISRRESIELDLSLYKALFEYSSEAMMITDDHEIITHINPAYTQITGYCKQEVIGKTPKIISSKKQSAEFYKDLWQKLNTQGSWQGELFNRKKNGDIFPVYQCINSIKINAKTSLYISVFSDISEHKEYEETLKQHAYYDPLTNLPNRNLLQDRLSQTIAKMHRNQQFAALLFLDLDNFKKINDSLGHDFGDMLLKKVATRLCKNFREIDSISRFGGDEFVILINELSSDAKTSENLVKNLLNKLLQLLSKPYFILGHELFVSASIGITLFPTAENDQAEDIIKMADIAMYAAKTQEKGSFQFYTPEMQEKAHQRLYIENGLREAIKHNQLVLFFQCQYNNDKELLGMEALVRWQHPEQGLIYPNDFIPIAEESGLIISMGEIIIKQACLQIKQWESKGHSIPHIAVNVSPRQFAEKDFVDKVCTICKEANIPHKQLMLELTEATIIHDIEITIKKMSQLQQLGYRISIDDFGTGYSSLAYLNKLPINQLKIDKSFIDDISLENKQVVIVDTIIAMAQHLNLNLIAEGVESQYQVDYLVQQGCLGFQGYYFSKPIPAEEVLSNHLEK